MTRKIFPPMTVFLFLSCNSSTDNNQVPITPTDVNWSITGRIGAAYFTNLNKDTGVAVISSRSGTSSLKLNGYDTTYFQDSINIMHLQSVRSVVSEIDSSGNFTFDNLSIFGYNDGGHSVRVTPRKKPNVNLIPQSVIAFGSM